MKKTLISTAAALTAIVGLGSTALAGHDEVKNDKVAKYTYELNPVQDESIPNSQATGTTKIMVLPNGNVKVQVKATGLAPNLPHLMHLHDIVGSDEDGNALTSDCPVGEPNEVDTIADGVPFYGGIQIFLETQVADENGTISYSEQFAADTPLVGDAEMTLGDIAGTAQVVVHGIDFDGNGVYAINEADAFASQPTSLPNVDAPLEFTAPVLCGGVPN